jgi:hypothetical protein
VLVWWSVEVIDLEEIIDLKKVIVLKEVSWYRQNRRSCRVRRLKEGRNLHPPHPLDVSVDKVAQCERAVSLQARRARFEETMEVIEIIEIIEIMEKALQSSGCTCQS